MKKTARIELFVVACGLALMTGSDVQAQWLTTGNAIAADGILGTNSGSNFGIRFQTNGTERMRLDNTGRLLIGLTSVPVGGLNTSQLHIRQNANDWIQMRRTADNTYWSFFNSNTATPSWKLNFSTNAAQSVTMFSVNVLGNIGVGDVFDTQMNAEVNLKTTTGDWFNLHRTQDPGYWAVQNASSGTMMSFNYIPFSGPALNNRLVLHNNGKVSIGTTNCPGTYGLYVATGILTEKVKVGVIGTANWADHVFEPDYALMPLDEVADFISCNGHLPGVPSAEEMVKEGIDVAKTDAMLMAKIEELTLYLLQMKAEMDELKQAASNK